MNNKQYELIGESIWNTYSDIANIIQGQRQDESVFRRKKKTAKSKSQKRRDDEVRSGNIIDRMVDRARAGQPRGATARDEFSHLEGDKKGDYIADRLRRGQSY